MATKPLTTAEIAMTERKVDMALDDIIKMSKNGTGINKAKKQRIFNKNQNFSNNVVRDKSMKLRRYVDSRSTVRQGALAQRRSNFQGNQFPLAVQNARKAAVAPIHNRNFSRNQTMTSYRQRVTNGGFAVKQHQQQQVRAVTKQRAQTLDSLFANMKEQRMKVLSHQQNKNSNNNNHNNGGRRNAVGQHRPGPPWTRYNN